jgi:hypothetical protein
MTRSFRTLCFLTMLAVLFVSLGTGTRAKEPARNAPAPLVPTEIATSCEHSPAAFITWSPKEFECPVCKTKNIFMVVMSYGSYVYQFPSKYQLVFWPGTDGTAWYSCKKCRYTRFMGNFEQVPPEKLGELRTLLAGVTLPPQKELSEKEALKTPPYLQIPASDKLVVVEKIERLLGETRDERWNHFYRLMAYHFAAEKKQALADEHRRKALAITERQLQDKANEGKRKELVLLVGAMHYFLRDDAKAKANFEQAAKLEYVDTKLDAEQNKNYNEYLSTIIKEYLDILQKGKGPRDETYTDH